MLIDLSLPVDFGRCAYPGLMKNIFHKGWSNLDNASVQNFSMAWHTLRFADLTDLTLWAISDVFSVQICWDRCENCLPMFSRFFVLDGVFQ